MSGEEKPKWMGAFEYYLNKNPDPVPLNLYELFPPRKVSDVGYRPLRSACGSVPHTLELWCSGGPVRVILGAESEAPLRFFSQAYGRLQHRRLGKKTREPEFVSEHGAFIGFDAELDHAFPYTFWEEDHKILDRLSAAISGPAWIQLAFIDYNWSLAAERAGQGIQIYFEMARRSPHPAIAGSSLGKFGERVGGEFVEKGQGPGKFLHIRGLLPDPGELPAAAWSGDAIESVFRGLSVHFDNVFVTGYRENQTKGVLGWLRSRNVPDPTKFIEMNAKIFENVFEAGVPRWGHGREFIPGFPLTPEELTYFLSLPSKASLSRSGARTKRKPRGRSKGSGGKSSRKGRERPSDEKTEERMLEEETKEKEKILREMWEYAEHAVDELGNKKMFKETEKFLDALTGFGWKLAIFAGRISELRLREKDEEKAINYDTHILVGLMDAILYLLFSMRSGQKFVLGSFRRLPQVKKAQEVGLTDAERKGIRSDILEVLEENAGKLGDKNAETQTKKMCRELRKFGKKCEAHYKKIMAMGPDVEVERLASRDLTPQEWKELRDKANFMAGTFLGVVRYILTLVPPDQRGYALKWVADRLFGLGLLQR